MNTPVEGSESVGLPDVLSRPSFDRAPELPAAREALIVALLALLFGFAFSYPVLEHLGELQVHRDWGLFWTLKWVPYHTILDYHQFPLWDPYRCRGEPMFARAVSSLLTPFLLVDLIFGFARGVQLEIPLHLAVAWAGGYLLGRALGMSRIAAAACASIFPASSWFPLHLAEGHLWTLPAAYLPWIFACFTIGLERRTLTPIAIAAALEALTLYEGGPYITTQAGLLASLIALAISIRERDRWPLIALSAFTLLSIGFAGTKLLPMWAHMRSHPRPEEFHEWNGLRTMVVSFLSRNQDAYRVEPWRWHFHEYGAYVGVTGAAMAAAGTFSASTRKWPWIGLLLLCLILAPGDANRWYMPAGLLHHIPVFTAERVPSRFYIPAVLAIGVLGGFGIDMLIAGLRRTGAIVAIALMVLHLADAMRVGTPNLHYIFSGQPVLRLERGTGDFKQAAYHRGLDPFEAVAAGEGGWVDPYCVPGRDPVKALGLEDSGYKGEQYLTGVGQLARLKWSPNRLVFVVNLHAPANLIVNQNYYKYWRVTHGSGQVIDDAGLLAVRLPAGQQTIVLRYRDLSVVGAAITLVTSLAAIVMCRRYDARPKSQRHGRFLRKFASACRTLPCDP